MSKIDNPHTCGACGYDGGVKNEKEASKLRERIAYLESKDPFFTQDKVVGLTVSLVISLLVGWGAWHSYVAPADNVVVKHIHNHKSPLEDLANNLRVSYEKCIARSYDSAERKFCASTFNEGYSKALNKLEVSDVESNQ